MERLVCLVIGYCFGLFQTGFIYGKIKHVDIRKYGSGNAGTTNAMRTLGKSAGAITYIGDTSKAVLAALVVRLIYGDSCSDFILLLVIYSGLGTVLGHNFPFYLKFKGGKGIATTSGVIISTYSIPCILLGFLSFIGTAFITRMVSASSLVLMVVFFVTFTFVTQAGMCTGLETDSAMYEAYLIVFILVVLAFIRHRSNIVRIINGTERKLGQKKD